MKRKKRLALPFLTAALKSNKLLNVNTACQKSVKSKCKRGFKQNHIFLKLQIGSGNVYGVWRTTKIITSNQEDLCCKLQLFHFL